MEDKKDEMKPPSAGLSARSTICVGVWSGIESKPNRFESDGEINEFAKRLSHIWTIYGNGQGFSGKIDVWSSTYMFPTTPYLLDIATYNVLEEHVGRKLRSKISTKLDR